MNRLSKQKKTQFILVAVLTVIIVAGLWYTLIRYQQAGLQTLETKRKTAQTELARIQDTIRNSREIEADLLSVSNELASREADMPAGDLYSSMVDTISRFKAPYRVDVPQFTTAGAAVDVNLLPKFPYKQVSIGISGSAYYFDLGRFVADFENRFPFSRVQNLDLLPSSATRFEDKEKLNFKMEIVSLVKPSPAVRSSAAP